MKARAITNLNIRTGIPNILPNNNPGFYRSGDIFEIQETVTGRSYKSNNIWYKLTDGAYVWSGGVNIGMLGTSEGSELFINDLAKNISLKNRDSIGSDGKGTIIGVLDNGIDISHHSLKIAVLSEENNLQRHETTITSAHGTSVAGIIVGDEKYVKGVARGAKIRSYKIVNPADGVESIALKTSLDNILKVKNVDILNLSIEVNASNIGFLNKVFADLLTEDIIIVIAGNVLGKDKINPLAKIPGLTKVGAFDSFNNVEALSQMDVCFINKEINTIGIESSEIPHSFKDSSAYCALVSAIIARALNTSQTPRGNRLEFVKNFLKTNSFEIEKIIQPLKMYHP